MFKYTVEVNGNTRLTTASEREYLAHVGRIIHACLAYDSCGYDLHRVYGGRARHFVAWSYC